MAYTQTKTEKPKARPFNTSIKSKVVDVRKPPQSSHLVNGRPWWAVAPRVGLTQIARERRAGR